MSLHIANKSLKKGIHFSDIHFGRKSNSPEHNTDCINFLKWVGTIIQNDPSIDYVAFLGDWHESRTAIDVGTMNFSYQGGQIIDSWHLPTFFLIGNHDMGAKFTRDIYSTVNFNEFSNFVVISEGPYVSPYHITPTLFVPFLQKDEYPALSQYNNYKLWAGHFEFKDFVLTGHSFKLDSGPDIDDFKSVGTILSGHFHKRQRNKNTQYIGNCFPMDFGDANDYLRGCAVYDHQTEETEYFNWLECPKYIRCKLSEILDETRKLENHSFIEIDLDVNISYQQLVSLDETLRKQYLIRSLYIDESSKYIIDSSTTDDESSVELDSISTEDLIIQLLSTVESKTLDSDKLIQIYRDLL